MSTASPLPLQPLPASTPSEAEARALRQQVASRLAEHRQRRPRAAETQAALEMELPRNSGSGPKRRIAEEVAARFAQTVSYRDFLQQEAEAAIRQAEAAAEVTRRNAEAIAAAQQQLLDEINEWHAREAAQFEASYHNGPAEIIAFAAPGATTLVDAGDPLFHASTQPHLIVENSTAHAAKAEPVGFQAEAAPSTAYADGMPQSKVVAPSPQTATATQTTATAPTATAPTATAPVTTAKAKVAAAEPAVAAAITETQSVVEAPAEPPAPQTISERFGLDTTNLEPATPIPANLIEFPRQLVAARRARPRLAEGPLRDEADAAPERAQLRIFEVEASSVSTEPVVESVLPEWHTIRLESNTDPYLPSAPDAQLSFTLPMYVAPVSRRLMALAVDSCCIATTFLLAVAAAAYASPALPTGVTAVLSAAGMVFAFGLFYQLLFFTLSDSTPGMRYARIGLCTFSDENPTRSAMRKRIGAILLAGMPLGLGLLWAALDEEGLGWHDRISRMYPRAY